MPNEILQQFLDDGLLDVGEDTERFTHVADAAHDLAEKLREDKPTLLRAASVLVGDRLVEAEPIAKLCDDAIKKHWPTYRSRFPTAPNELIRATLLQAIANVTADSDANSSALVYYAASSIFPYATNAKHAPIFEKLLTELGKTAELAAATHWADHVDAAPQKLSYGDAKIPIAGVNVKALAEGIRNSAGPYPGAVGHNTEWPSANTTTWLEHFGKNSADAISAAIVGGLKDLVAAVVAQTRADHAVVVDAIRGPDGAPSDRLRTRLLYWSATLFSSSRLTSYRKLAPSLAAYWTARDLSDLVPRFHPRSVEYFLRETFRKSIGDLSAAEEMTLDRFCTEATDVSLTGAPLASNIDGLTLLNVVHSAAASTFPPADAASRLGLNRQTTISREELAVWLFRDFQALRLAGAT